MTAGARRGYLAAFACMLVGRMVPNVKLHFIG